MSIRPMGIWAAGMLAAFVVLALMIGRIGR